MIVFHRRVVSSLLCVWVILKTNSSIGSLYMLYTVCTSCTMKGPLGRSRPIERAGELWERDSMKKTPTGENKIKCYAHIRAQ